MRVLFEYAGAQRGALLLKKGGELLVAAEGDAARRQVRSELVPLDEWQGGARRVVSYVGRRNEAVVIGDASQDERYASDPYLKEHGVRSLLCMPIRRNAEVVGALYIENNLTPDAFTDDRIIVLNALAGQLAISLENAQLYEDLRAAA